MTTLLRLAQCMFCTHRAFPAPGATVQTCTAFPAGIPDVIWRNEADHREPFEGDGGIRFEPRPGARWPEPPAGLDTAKGLDSWESDVHQAMEIAEDTARDAALEKLAKHLPGQHDQGSHGTGGSPAKLHDDEATIRATYDYHDAATGLTARVVSIRNTGPNQSTYVDIEVKDRTGAIVGGGTRSIRPADQKTVRHDGFALEPEYQGKGFATRYNQRVEQSYRDNGIQQITLHASGGGHMTGGYAWARAGYDFTTSSRSEMAALVPARVQQAGARYSPTVRDQFARVAADPFASPIDYAMVGWQPGATTWPGKEIMLESSWEGVKTL